MYIKYKTSTEVSVIRALRFLQSPSPLVRIFILQPRLSCRIPFGRLPKSAPCFITGPYLCRLLLSFRSLDSQTLPVPFCLSACLTTVPSPISRSERDNPVEKTDQHYGSGQSEDVAGALRPWADHLQGQPRKDAEVRRCARVLFHQIEQHRS